MPGGFYPGKDAKNYFLLKISDETVKRLRPFLRRRDNTARPQRVCMRLRNP